MSNFVGFYNYTVIATYAGFAGGMCGLYFAATGNCGAAIVCLLIAGFFDMIDGKIARHRPRSRDEKRFGVQIDSLSDLVCFGVLPAMIGYACGLRGWLNILILTAYTLCGLIRLAYFNVLAAAAEETEKQGQSSYRGLPITSSALLFPLLYALRPADPASFRIFYTIGLLLLGAAFIAPITIKKPGKLALLGILAAGLLTIILLFTSGL